MKPVLPENLSDLPVFKDWREETITEPGGEYPVGTTVRHRVVPRLCLVEVSGDMPVLFSDEEGSWFIDYHLEGGPYKRRAWL